MSLLMHAVHTLQEKPRQKRTPNGGSEFWFTSILKNRRIVDMTKQKADLAFGLLGWGTMGSESEIFNQIITQ